MQYIIDGIGFFGPELVFIISFIKLLPQLKYLIGYLVFLVLNTGLNAFVKDIIKQPRPTNGRKFLDEVLSGSHIYGMPSGHAQSVFFSMTYLYLTKRSTYILILEGFIVALTLYQRWKYRRHTIEQLSAGAFLGGLIAYFSYHITRKWITSQSTQLK